MTGCGQETSWEARWGSKSPEISIAGQEDGARRGHIVVRGTDAQRGEQSSGFVEECCPPGVG